ncbi:MULTISPECIES: hypothetical protein [unclassified Sphingobium]|uniref:hypothetical protein n=1 Tax=unclassified Sphingobium TaxID=2611147 RepID=UPI0022254575|nr:MULTISPECIES: hypothetical protein [unclassified Sphingobium]MCW2412959.1 hypothetical protein [Sphingobium sp. B8D3D]MCW2414741.1 hypothetical protein [Sphingobium sp. B8D3A]
MGTDSSIRHGFCLPLLLLFASSCGNGAVPIIEMHFGTTEWVWNSWRPASDYPASDYIADFHRKIPAAAKRCGVTLLGANGGITDGGEAAYFLPRQSPDAAQACLKRHLPQGHFGLIKRDEWENRTNTDPSFPVALSSIPQSVELPLP